MDSYRKFYVRILYKKSFIKLNFSLLNLFKDKYNIIVNKYY